MKFVRLLLLTLLVSASFGGVSHCVADPAPLSTDPTPLHKAITVSGTAVDDTGKPVPNLQLLVERNQTDGDGISIPAVTTRADGSFTIGQLIPGSYYVDPGAQWTVTAPATFDVPAAGPIKLLLKKSVTTTLQGTAVDTSGAPLSGVSVVFEANHVISNGNFVQDDVVATTDSSGYFTVSDVPFDQNSVQSQSFTKDGYVYRSGGLVSSQGDKLSVSLIVMAKLGASVSGIVRNGLNAPVADAWVSCPTGTGDIRPIQTDASGHFKFTDLLFGLADIYAAKGRYFGHLSVQASDKSSADPVTIVLSLMPPPPTPSDLVAGTQMVSSLLDSILSSPTVNNASFYRDAAAEQLETVSPTAGLNFLVTRTKANARDLGWVLHAQSKQNPNETAQWVIPIIENADDIGDSGRLAAVIGLDIAPYDISAATSLYNFAATKISLDNLSQDNIDRAMEYVALAYAVHRADADVSYGKVMAEINHEIASIRANPTTYNNSDWLLISFAEVLARGNLSLALTLIKSSPLLERNIALSQIVSELVRPDPEGALVAYHTIDKDDPNSALTYDSCLAQLLPIIFKTDHPGALALARDVVDPSSRSLALTIVADLLPLAQAKPLYIEAESDSQDQPGQGATPASVAAHAYLRDPELGAILFQQAFDKVMLPSPTDDASSGPAYAEFAFYYSRINPGYSRLLIEDLFRRDSIHPNENDGTGIGLSSDVAAMAAIDPVRANDLASSIPDLAARFFAGLSVVQYILMSQHSRETLPFFDWIEAADGWTPATTNVW